MIDPCIRNVHAYDFPSLALAARDAAELAESQRAASESFQAVYVGSNEALRQNMRRHEALCGAIRNDHYRLAHLADLLERHPSLVEAIAAVEGGGRVTVEQPVRPRGVPESVRAQVLNRAAALIAPRRSKVTRLTVAREPA